MSMQGDKPTTIKEIAKKLKISPSTVSRALNDHPSIGLVTTMRVKKVGVDVMGTDGVPFAICIEVLEQVLTRQLQAALDHRSQTPVADTHLVLHATLAAKLELDLAALDIDMPVAQSGQPIGLVLTRVLAVADADQGRVEQHHHGCEDLFPSKPRLGDLCFEFLAQFWQRLAKRLETRVLVTVAYLTPARVIAVLLATTGIAAGSLQMALRVGTDPHVGIRRRHGQCVQALDFIRILDPHTFGVEVLEFATQRLAANAGLGAQC